MCEASHPSIFGQRVKIARDKRRFSQAELAERARVTPNLVSRLESGEVQWPNANSARRLARALGVTLDWLTGLVDEADLGERATVEAGVAAH